MIWEALRTQRNPERGAGVWSSLTGFEIIVFIGNLGPMPPCLLVQILQLLQSLNDDTSLVALKIGITHLGQRLGLGDKERINA